LITILTYLVKFGGESHIFITDFLAALYSFIAIVIGIFAIKIYSLKSLQGKTLALIVLGIISWFLADFIFLIFSSPARYYSESLRFLGYLPLIIAFFGVLRISDPAVRESRRKLFYFFGIFLTFSIVYLGILPLVLGSKSFLGVVLTEGYVMADFILLFGVFLLLKTSLAFKTGSMEKGWLVIAIAFLSTFIFDLYFAFNSQVYSFGDFMEIFWLLTYVLLAYGLFLHYKSMKNLIEPEESEEPKKGEKQKEGTKSIK